MASEHHPGGAGDQQVVGAADVRAEEHVPDPVRDRLAARTREILERPRPAASEEQVAREALEGGAHDEAVEAEVREAASMGARGVPFFLFNDKYTAPGALPTDAFRQALRQIAEEARAERGEAEQA